MATGPRRYSYPTNTTEKGWAFAAPYLTWARDHPYGRALRGVADRLLGVACVLLQRQALFDPNHGKSAPA